MICTHSELLRILESFEVLGPTGRYDLMVQLANETGGYFKPPQPTNNWDSQQFEVKAMGVYASGETETSAIRNWIRAARSEASATIELERAIAILDGAATETDLNRLKAACDLVIHAGRTPYEKGRARQVMNQLETAPLSAASPCDAPAGVTTPAKAEV